MIESACRKYLVDLATRHARLRGVTLATIARKVHGSFDFFDKYKAGKCSVTITKYDEMVAELGGDVVVAAAKTAVDRNGKL